MPSIRHNDGMAGRLTNAVDETLGQMAWLTPADKAMRELALHLAGEIDTARARAEEFGQLNGTFEPESDAYIRLQKLEAWCDLAKTVGMLGPRLRDVLRDLGGAPNARAGLDTAPEKSAGKLATMLANADRLKLVQGGNGA